MLYTWEDLFFMKKYMVWLISALMAVSMTACSNAQKKDTKDQAQITTAAKENETQTEAAKTTSKKEKKNEKKKDKKKTSKKKSQKKKDSKKTKSSTDKKKKTSAKTTSKKKIYAKKKKRNKSVSMPAKHSMRQRCKKSCIPKVPIPNVCKISPTNWDRLSRSCLSSKNTQH